MVGAAGAVLTTALHGDTPEHIEENHYCDDDFEGEVPPFFGFVGWGGEDAVENEDECHNDHKGVERACIRRVIQPLHSQPKPSFFGRNEQWRSKPLRRLNRQYRFLWILLYFCNEEWTICRAAA